MALVPVRGLIYRQAGLRHLCTELATKGGKQIKICGIVKAFPLPRLALPQPKFISAQDRFPGCGPGTPQAANHVGKQRAAWDVTCRGEVRLACGTALQDWRAGQPREPGQDPRCLLNRQTRN